ncbi:MAG: phosphoenolpyruvate--protein phosphotransferase [Aliivibrio sp.]|uniref:phosphoenolpyruvate--protein phosphotransferase n=1 Tax=Aliivibrio sp. TaxID=1872443 RepID=UPI001A48767E|nr:phosphoenolpyruvate--protein phosphotransferase [Aliivibrio sp.]
MLTQLREIVEQVSKVDDLRQSLDILVIETCKAMKTECCSIYIVNEEKKHLELMATKGLETHKKSVTLDVNEGLVGLVYRTVEPLNLADAINHSNYKYVPEIGEEIYHSFLATPIVHRRNCLGVIVIQQRKQRSFTDVEESFLVTLAAQLAVIFAHAKSQGQWFQSNRNQTQIFSGIAASPGVAIAPLWWSDDQPKLELVSPCSSLDIDQELENLSRALELAMKDFRKLRKRLVNDINKDTLAIFDLFIHLLNDPILREDLKKQIKSGDCADWALRQVVESYAARFNKMSDPYLRERSQDIKELGQRLLHFLYNGESVEYDWPHPVILITQELTASLLASIPKGKLKAVVSMEGAANSHAAILSRALGILAVMGVDIVPQKLHNKKSIVDGYSGQIFVRPSRTLVKEYKQLLNEEIELSKLVEGEIEENTQTKDQLTINLFLNAGLSADTSIAINKGVKGVGLYRTEIPFLLHHRFPSEDEQTLQYRSVLKAYPNKPVVMRTLDVGGDKPLPYLCVEEDNPFLGWRGIRFTLDHPDIFLIQLRAMLKASVGLDNMDIMLPMISGLKELDEALAFIEQAYNEVSELSDYQLKRPKIGIMIEVPSMLYLLPQVAKKVDFISVGSNDLTQYLLAVDRNNSRVADVYDSLHPAVIAALKHIIDISNQHKLPVCLCGELAGDPIGALILVGLGYRSLSMNTSSVAKIKYILRQVSLAELVIMVDKINHCYAAEDIREMMVNFLESKGLGGFIRAGK